MATAFTVLEKESIRAKLKDEAGRLASSVGMRKTSVDQLAGAAGISKGAFYKLFYESKELLFLEVFEDWHTEIYGKAREMLREKAGLRTEDCLYEVFMEMLRLMKSHSILRFMQNDLPFLLRKIPPEMLRAHYHSDDAHIRELMEDSGIRTAVTPEQISAIVHVLMYGFLNMEDTADDDAYITAKSLLIRSVCRMVVHGEES